MSKKSSDLKSIKHKIDALNKPKGRYINGKKMKMIDDLLLKAYMCVSGLHRDKDKSGKYGFVYTKKEIEDTYGKKCPICEFVDIAEQITEVLGI